MDHKNTRDDEIYHAHPRKKIPQPTEYEPLNLNMSPIPQAKPEKKLDESLDISSDESPDTSEDEELGVKPLEVIVLLPFDISSKFLLAFSSICLDHGLISENLNSLPMVQNSESFQGIKQCLGYISPHVDKII